MITAGFFFVAQVDKKRKEQRQGQPHHGDEIDALWQDFFAGHHERIKKLGNPHPDHVNGIVLQNREN